MASADIFKIKKDKCLVMPLPLSISYRKKLKRPEAGTTGIRCLPRIRMAPLHNKEEETGGHAWMVTLSEDQMGGMESPANMTRRNGLPHS